MDDALYDILRNLNYIKDSLIKLGPKRRVGSNFERKILEAKAIYVKFEELLRCTSTLQSNELILLSATIQECYGKIMSLEKESDILFSNSSSSSEKMAGEIFCMKTAVSLLPKMSGDEKVTQELIDAIEMYSSMLNDDGKKLLIGFVLKCRLSSGAKLRLSTSYTSIDLLMQDMRTHLLSRKSDTALQQQMQRVKQGDRTIREFGAEIEQLFVDLTISQANGDEAAYKILQPINEKNAIKCFSNGLKSQRIGTIISSRNITEIKDAIRVAEDETNSFSNQQVFTYNRRGRSTFNFRSNFGRNFSNRSRPQRGNQHTRGAWRGNGGMQGGSSYGAARTRGADTSFRGSRYVRGRYRGHSNYSNLNHFTSNQVNGENNSKNEENPELGEFFRP